MSASLGSPIAVRPIRVADFDQWKPLWRGYTAFYRAEMNDASSEGAFRRLCGEDGGMFGLVAVDRERLVGLSHLVMHSNTWGSASSCYLQDLYVDPDSRGSGVAARLFEAVYAAARERAADRVYWHTQQFNAPARSLYDTVGRPTSFVVYEQSLV